MIVGRGAALETRTLGGTGLEISRLVFGCGAVGGVVFNAPADEGREAVRRALAAGVNWFDTAASYGDGRSEQRIGEILRELRATPKVSTKVGLKPEELADIPGAIRRSLERSLRRLGRDRVDLFQLHNQVTPARGDRPGSIAVEDVLGKKGAARAFEQLRGEGLFGWSGFTGLGEPGSLRRVVESGAFHTVQAYFNLLNPSAILPVPRGFAATDLGQVAAAAHGRGMGVLNIRVLAAGALAGKPLPAGGAPLVDGADAPAEAARAARLREALGVDDAGLHALALRFARARPEIDGVLVGFATAAQVDAALAAFAAPPLDDATFARVERLYHEPPFFA
jgi:aryl-alcohol dehydrogenase-like predicted oxidoreductase